jgi:hypothetical protein
MISAAIAPTAILAFSFPQRLVGLTPSHRQFVWRHLFSILESGIGQTIFIFYDRIIWGVDAGRARMSRPRWTYPP